jgi:hypothetical protein
MRFQSSFQTLSGFLPRRTPLLKLKSKIASAVAAGLTLAAVLGPVSAAKAQGVKFDPTIITYAGTGSLTVENAGNGGQATAAGLNNPEGIAYDTRGNTYIADYYNNTIRIVNAAGVISAFAGTGAACANATAACGDGGAASAATFNNPSAMQFDSKGNLYIADYADQRIRKITATNGVITGASIISTVAGTGTAGSTGNTGLATAAALYNPHGVALDAAGDLWIANQGQGNGTNCTIGYVPATAQTITIGGVATNVVAGHYYVVAGEIGTCGGAVTGAGTQGTNVQLSAPTNVALDSLGNLFIGDYANGKVRKLVTSTGVISTVAGTVFGACPVTAPTAAAPNPVPNCGDGGLATAATLNGPTGVYVDSANNVIIGDAFGARVREINGLTGIISTVAGDSQQCTNISQTATNASYPTCGDGGAATKALVSFPILISVNPAGNILYVDQYDNKIREIVEHIVFPPTNVGAGSTVQNVNLITTGTGNTIITGISVPSDPAGNPEFTVGTVTGCVVGGATGNVPGTVCTIPVTFNPAYVGTQSAPLVVVTNGGTFQFGLTGTGVGPQAIILPGTLSTVAGTGTAGTTGNGGQAAAATLNTPRALTFDASGNYYIGDLVSNEVRKVTPAGVISAFAGGGTTNYITNPGGPATSAALGFPTQGVFDSAGNMYIADFNHHVVARVDAVTKAISVYAGNGTAGYSGDGGAATSAELSGPAALAVDQSTGDLYIADSGTGTTSNQTVRVVNASSGIISTVAGNGTVCASPTAACGDGGQGTAAQLNQPNGLALDVNGNLYISDTFDNRIRLLTKLTGVITTVAGTGTAGYSGDGAAATGAALNTPFQIQLDAAGDLFIADTGNNAVRFVSAATGKISTVAGVSGSNTACTTVPAPSCGDGGAATVSAFSAPTGIALDVSGNMYVADSGTNRVREITVNPALLTFPPAPAIGVTEGPLTAMLTNIGNATLTYTTPTAGTNALVTTTSNPTTGTASPVTSNAFAQTNATTCGPISSTSATTTLASGVSCNYIVSFTPDTAIGNYVGTLVETDNSLYSGNVNPSNTTNPIYPTPFTQTVNLTGSAVKGTASISSLVSSLNPSYLGQSVTFTATLTGGGVPPTGTVTFTYTPTGSTTPVPIGTGTVSTTAGVTTAKVTTSTLPLGVDTVVATYGGDTNYVAGATNTLPQTVQQVPGTGDSVSANPNPVTFGSPTTLTFCIPVGTGASLGAAVPTGTVQFSYGTPATSINTPVNIGTTPTNETVGGVVTSCYVAQTTTSTLPLGTDTVAGTFTPGAGSGYAALVPAPTTPVVVTPVTPASTVTTNPVNGSAPACGSSVTLTDTLTQINNAAFSGTIQFYDNGNMIGNPIAVSAGGTASLPTTALSCGSNNITAIFTPAAGSPYNTSNGGPTPLTLGGDAITFPALPNTPFGSTPPVPAATATNNGTPVTYATTSTACSVTSAGVITFNDAGSCAITASQAAGPTYAAPTPVTNTFQITPVTPPSVITPPATTPACGASATLTDTITSVGGYTVAGTVQFYDNGTMIGAPVPVGAGGTAILNTTSLSCGTSNVTAIFTPTAGGPYNPSTAGPTPVTVGADAITFPALPNTPFGSTPPVPAATATNNGTPVTYATTSTACSVTSAGVITFNNIGSCAITASQAAGTTYAAPTPVTNTFQITPVSPPSTITPPATTPACGASATLIDTITQVGGYTVAGTVQFYDNGTMIGAPVPVGAGGIATLATTALTCGVPNSITAIFTPTPGGPYTPSTAGPTVIPVAAADFTIAATPPNQVVNPGDSAVYTVSLAGVTVPFTSPVALTATCNCQGVTISFANATVTPGLGPTTTAMTVTTSPTFAMSKPSHGANQIFYGLLLLPLLGLGKVRRKLRTLPKGISYCLAALVLLGGLGAVTGCGGGYYGPQPKTCTITITGTSGTLTHSTTVTVTVR